jgi:hypothetical protein
MPLQLENMSFVIATLWFVNSEMMHGQEILRLV